jgi:hypothetical protein
MRLRALWLLPAVLAASAAQAQVTPTREAAEEALLLLRHPQVREVVPALWLDGQFFLPLATVLRALHVDATHDARLGTVRGYYLDANHTYLVSSASAVAVIDGRRVDIAGAFIADTADLFVTTRVFRDVFGLQLTPDMQQLAVLVTTTDTLPLQRQYLREQMRRPETPHAVRPHAPLRYGRERQLFRVGHARYSALGEVSKGTDVASWDVAVAGEALGGDAWIAVDGAYRQGGRAIDRVHGRWQLVLDSSAVVSQVRLGNLLSTGLAPRAFRGVQLTNAPPVPRLVAGEFPLSGVAGPFWEVELYYDNRLLAHATADAGGRYHFAVPLVYGAALLELRLYSPTGAVTIERRRLPMPAVFLPAGMKEYHVALGASDDGDDLLVQGRVEHGVSQHVTAFAGYERGERAGERLEAPYVGATVRANRTWLGSIEAAPGVLTRVAASALHPSNASVSLLVTDYAGPSLLNPDDAHHRSTLQALLPARLGGVPLFARTSAEHTTYDGGSAARGEFSVGANLAGFSPAAAYRTERRHAAGGTSLRRDELVLSTLHFGNAGRGVLGGLLRNTMVRSAVGLDARAGAARWLQLELTRVVQRDNRLTVAIRDERDRGGTSLQLRYAYTGRQAHATSSIRHAAGATFVAQGVRGTIGYDAARRAVEYTGTDWTGRAAVAIHAFVDYNGNGVRDDDEPRIGVPVIRFPDAVSTRMTPDSVLLATDLQPYRRYSVRVLRDRVPNPLWIPRDTAFSLVTDPNGFKQVPVPFLVAGVVEGRLVLDGVTRPPGGVPIVIHAADGSIAAEETTFSDGTWYHLGLAPGDYTASIPTPHLDALKWDVAPARFTIRPSHGGDIVSDVVIRVRPQ